MSPSLRELKKIAHCEPMKHISGQGSYDALVRERVDASLAYQKSVLAWGMHDPRSLELYDAYVSIARRVDELQRVKKRAVG